MFALILTSSLSACAQKAVHTTITYSNSRDIDTRGMTKDILYYINQYRASIGLPALQMINEATSEATKHSVDMANRTTAFGHDGFDERIDNIVKKIGIVHASAENVAYGKLTAKEVVDLWLNSPGHKKNIEGNYALTGIGIAKDADGIVFYTQIFLKK
ncbi:MAG TPA: CAP domain-containing protein [Chitinophagaceae bacterium]|nr:CAP domain-containing protein [Chitinophagaceae bacterium]